MSYDYAVSDIHGHLDIFEETMKLVDLSGENRLILLGDYINRGPDSCGVLKRVYDLQQQYGENKVIVLMGNHEFMLLEYMEEDFREYSRFDKDFLTVEGFLKENPEILKWLKKLPYYFETEKQIYVHAGIDEEAGEWWNIGTSEYFFVSTFQVAKGKFYKDVIAGHVGVSKIRGNDDPDNVYHDGESHYYIDGSVYYTGRLLVLRYDWETGAYRSFHGKRS